jgi:hypothetical protein
MNGGQRRVVDGGSGFNPIELQWSPVVEDGQYALEEGEGDTTHFILK